MTSVTDNNSPYHSIDYFDVCMKEPHRWCLVMEADCGGWTLLVCPLTMLKATEENRVQLLLDLENVSGPGFRFALDPGCSDAQEMLFRGDIEEVCAGSWFATRGNIHRGVWIEQRVDDSGVRDQIARVLTGQQPRLMLPEWWPNDPPIPFQAFASLDEARAYAGRAIAMIEPRGRGTCQTMIRVPVDLIKIGETQLVRLSEYLARLDSLTDREYLDGISVRKSTITYQTQTNMRKRRLDDLWLADWLDARGMRDLILSVLRGQKSIP